MVDDDLSDCPVADDTPLRAIVVAIEEPRPAPQRFLIVGRTGSGKSHLLRDLARRMSARRPLLRSAESLVHELLEAVEGGIVDQLRDRVSAAKVLLIDDIDYLAGRPATQERLLRMLDSGRARGQVLVMTVRDSGAVDESLGSWIRPALVLELVGPDPTLVGMLRSALARTGHRVSEQVLREAASKASGRHDVKAVADGLRSSWTRAL